MSAASNKKAISSVRRFWKALDGQQDYFTVPKAVDGYPIFHIQTVEDYIFDDAFWDVFHRYPFHICHIARSKGRSLEMRFKLKP